MGYMNREIYPKVKVIMNQSIKEAKNFDDSKVRPEHIVLSMLSDDDNECTKVLKKLKIGVMNTKSCLVGLELIIF